MFDYLLVIFSAFLIGVNFSLTKIYQTKNGTSPKKVMVFSGVNGAILAVLMFIVNGFKVEAAPFSAMMAFIASALTVSYQAVGFKIMAANKVALYTVFLMAGGMIVPYVWGVLFLNEELSILRTIGLLIILLSVVISNFDNEKGSKKQLLLCCLIFFLNGFVSVTIKEHQINATIVDTTDFMALQAVSTTIASFIASLFMKVKKEDIKISFSSFLIIIAMVVVGGVSSFFHVEGAKDIPATVLYPIITGGTVIFTAVISRIVFKEKLTPKLIICIVGCLIGTLCFL